MFAGASTLVSHFFLFFPTPSISFVEGIFDLDLSFRGVFFCCFFWNHSHHPLSLIPLPALQCPALRASGTGGRLMAPRIQRLWPSTTACTARTSSMPVSRVEGRRAWVVDVVCVVANSAVWVAVAATVIKPGPFLFFPILSPIIR